MTNQGVDENLNILCLRTWMEISLAFIKNPIPKLKSTEKWKIARKTHLKWKSLHEANNLASVIQFMSLHWVQLNVHHANILRKAFSIN